MSVIETLKIPQDNVNDNDVTISSIYIGKNDYIDENTLILDYETSKQILNYQFQSQAMFSLIVQ